MRRQGAGGRLDAGEPMRRFIAAIVYFFDSRLPGPRVRGRESSEAYSEWEYETGKIILDSYGRHFGSLEEKRVLDIGCGLGGKTLAYAQAGAHVVGVDIASKNVAQAACFTRARGANVGLAAGDAEHLPFRDGTFDLVIANDSFEHFGNPAAALADLARVLRPGGSVFLFFTPWTSPLGSHLYDYIHTPWCHLVFPEWLIEGLLERAVAVRGADDPEGEARRLMGEYHSELNRITEAQYRRIVRQIPRIETEFEERKPPKFKFLAPLTAIPVAGAYFVGTVVGVLRKRA